MNSAFMSQAAGRAPMGRSFTPNEPPGGGSNFNPAAMRGGMPQPQMQQPQFRPMIPQAMMGMGGPMRGLFGSMGGGGSSSFAPNQSSSMPGMGSGIPMMGGSPWSNPGFAGPSMGGGQGSNYTDMMVRPPMADYAGKMGSNSGLFGSPEMFQHLMGSAGSRFAV